MGRKYLVFKMFCACILFSVMLSPLVASAAPSRPSAPTGLKATLSYPRVLLTWNANSGPGIIGYYVYRSLAAKTGFTKLNTSPTPSTSYADSPVVANKTYYYKVAAVNSAGTGSACAPVSISFYDNAPPVIAGTSAGSLSGSGAVIFWTTDEPANSQVDYGPSASYGQSTTLNSSLVTAHAVTLSGLAGDALYHYRVRSADARGNTAVSADYTFSTLDLIPPGNVLAFTAAAGNGQVSLSWSNPSTADFTGTRIVFSTTGYPATPGDGELLCDKTAAPGSSDGFVHTGLVNDTTYFYAAFAHDEVPNHAAGERVSGSPFGAPPVISDLRPSTVGYDQASIEWTTDKPATTELEYGICEDPSSSAPPQSGYVTTHALTVFNLTPGTLYCYRAISRDAAGQSAISPSRSFRTAGGDVSACLSCHNGSDPGAPYAGDFATDGHGKANINLICLDCHLDHQADPASYKYLLTVNDYSYPDHNPDWAVAVGAQKNFCNLACHSVDFFSATGGLIIHPMADETGDPLNPFARACLAGAVLPGPDVPLLDADLNYAQSCDDIIMCITCHTPHGKDGSGRMLRAGSASDASPLCQRCHPY